MATLYEYSFTRRKVSDALPSRCDAPELAFEHVRDLAHEESERLLVLVLNRKHRAIARETLYKGTVAGTSVRIGELFKAAIRLNGAGIVLAHNHPSGDPDPSADDRQTTAAAVKAGRLLGIDMLDHLVIGDPGWVSMRCDPRGFWP